MHLSTLRSIGDLVIIYSGQGPSEAAELLNSQVLNAGIRRLGEEHPDMVSSTVWAVHDHSFQGRWEEAESPRLRLVEGKRVRGIFTR